MAIIWIWQNVLDILRSNKKPFEKFTLSSDKNHSQVCRCKLYSKNCFRLIEKLSIDSRMWDFMFSFRITLWTASGVCECLSSKTTIWRSKWNLLVKLAEKNGKKSTKRRKRNHDVNVFSSLFLVCVGASKPKPLEQWKTNEAAQHQVLDTKEGQSRDHFFVRLFQVGHWPYLGWSGFTAKQGG